MKLLVCGALGLCLSTLVFAGPTTAPAGSEGSAAVAKDKADDTKVPLTISGGHDTDPRDHGRPVVLIAAALKVPEEVFRETFTHVNPAGPGRGGPTEAEARKNKAALMKGLAPYGVTDERLNEVSNFYRYARFNGEKLWRNSPADGYATVRNGTIVRITITNPGFGYSSEPSVSVKGFDDAKLKAKLSFDTDLNKNGSVAEVSVVPPPQKS